MTHCTYCTHGPVMVIGAQLHYQGWSLICWMNTAEKVIYEEATLNAMFSVIQQRWIWMTAVETERWRRGIDRWRWMERERDWLHLCNDHLKWLISCNNICCLSHLDHLSFLSDGSAAHTHCVSLYNTLE